MDFDTSSGKKRDEPIVRIGFKTDRQIMSFESEVGVSDEPERKKYYI